MCTGWSILVETLLHGYISPVLMDVQELPKHVPVSVSILGQTGRSPASEPSCVNPRACDDDQSRGCVPACGAKASSVGTL